MGAEPTVSQREYDRFVKTTDEDIAELRAAVAALEEQRGKDIKAAVESRNTIWMRRIAAVGAGAGAVAAWAALVELRHSLGR